MWRRWPCSWRRSWVTASRARSCRWRAASSSADASSHVQEYVVAGEPGLVTSSSGTNAIHPHREGLGLQEPHGRRALRLESRQKIAIDGNLPLHFPVRLEPEPGLRRRRVHRGNGWIARELDGKDLRKELAETSASKRRFRVGHNHQVSVPGENAMSLLEKTKKVGEVMNHVDRENKAEGTLGEWKRPRRVTLDELDRTWAPAGLDEHRPRKVEPEIPEILPTPGQSMDVVAGSASDLEHRGVSRATAGRTPERLDDPWHGRSRPRVGGSVLVVVGGERNPVALFHRRLQRMMFLPHLGGALPRPALERAREARRLGKPQ